MLAVVGLGCFLLGVIIGFIGRVPTAWFVLPEWNLVAMTVSACGAAVAAVGAWRGAFVVGRATDAHLAKSFLDQYGTYEWIEAVRYLDDYPYDAFSSKCVPSDPDHYARIKQDLNDDRQLDQARRRVHWLYRNAWHLYAGGLMNERAMLILTETHAYDVFHDIAKPLSRAMDDHHHTKERYGWYDRLFDEFRPLDSRPNERCRTDWPRTGADQRGKATC